VRFHKQADKVNSEHASAVVAEAKESSIDEAKAITEANESPKQKHQKVIISNKKSYLKSFVDLGSTSS